MIQLRKVETGRMLELATFLEDSVDPDRFTMRQWCAEPARPAKTRLFGLIEVEPACGFAGCAMGYAAHAGLFEGLRISSKGNLVYKGFTHFDAAAKLLGITEQTAIFLFDPSSYQSVGPTQPGEVAERLRCFVSKVESRLSRARTMARTEPEIEIRSIHLRLIS